VGNAALSASGPGRLARASGWLLAAVWAAELGALLTRAPLLSRAAMAGLAVFVALALLRASRHIRVLFLMVGGTAAVIALYLGDARVLVRGFERAQIFGAFLPSVLLLRATVEASPRVAALRRGIAGLTPAEARNWTLYGSHALGAVLNVGAMAILAPVVVSAARDADRLGLASSAARGVGTAGMWSPFFVAMAFSSQLVPGAALWQTMLIGMGLGALGLALSWRLFTPELGRSEFMRSVGQLRGLAAPTAVIVGVVVGCTVLLDINGLQAVALVLPLLCFGYLVHRGRDAMRATAQRTLANFSRLADELLIVAGAMVLGVAVGSLPAVGALAAGVSPGTIHGAALLGVLIATLVGLGQVGLHPMIGVSVVLPVVAAAPFGISPPVLVAAGVFSWGLSAAISVWTLPVAVAATTFQVPVARLWNARSVAFGMLMAVAGVVYLASLNAWMMGGSAH
jgi:hypothetical protein